MLFGAYAKMPIYHAFSYGLFLLFLSSVRRQNLLWVEFLKITYKNQ